MSDGDFGADKATPDATSELPRALGADGDEVGLAAATTGTRAAAPWERFGSSPQRVALAPRWSPPPTSAPPTSPLAEPGPDQDGGPTGCHTDGGLTVAELIAKIGGSTAARPRRSSCGSRPRPAGTRPGAAHRRARRRIRRLPGAGLPGLCVCGARLGGRPPGATRPGCRRADHRAAENAAPDPTGAHRRRART